MTDFYICIKEHITCTYGLLDLVFLEDSHELSVFDKAHHLPSRLFRGDELLAIDDSV